MNRSIFQSVTFVISTLVMIVTISALSVATRRERPLTPGAMTHGHYQIELKCDTCHGENEDSIQQACLTCHAEELKRVDDSHPVVKFKDPRNADRLKKIDARKCASCHREHQPELTRDMGVTLPEDYCAFCHQEIAEERPTHAGLGFETCATAGCHNFHDNSALYESFLAAHLHEADFLSGGKLPALDSSGQPAETTEPALSNTDVDMPSDVPVTRDLLNQWQASGHASAGVNCSHCHTSTQDGETQVVWSSDVSVDQCANCHSYQTAGFLAGKHGMRLAADLPPMQPIMARLPMHPESSHRQMDCNACHGSHRFDTRHAGVQACLACHQDDHSKAYLDSPHYTTWLNESRGVTGEGTGVGCATCHMPRVEVNRFGETSIEVDHNQNNSLRPNEKMIRSVCLHCHGLQFSLDSLADPSLILHNFKGRPKDRVASLDMVIEEQQRNEANRSKEP